MQTRQVIADLHSSLTLEGHYSIAFDATDTNDLNTRIVENWSEKVEKSLTHDLRRILNNQNVDIARVKSTFSIMDNEAEGAPTLWKSFITLADNDEKMDVVICFLVSYGNAFIYLGGSHTHFDKYQGTSESLTWLFNQLKSNEQVGRFFQTNLYDLARR